MHKCGQTGMHAEHIAEFNIVEPGHLTNKLDQIMSEFHPVTEVAKLRQQTRAIRQPRYSRSRLDKFAGELISLHAEGATIAELQRWLRKRRISVQYTTVYRWITKHGKI